MDKVWRIGLTGGIGSGKSTAAQVLAQVGAAVIDADALARSVTAPGGSAIGLHCQPLAEGAWQLAVWDGGAPIALEERETIFERGVRGRGGQNLAGTGLGLALGRDLARSLGGELNLVVPPAAVAPELPPQGNAFCLRLPGAAAPGH